MSSEAASIGRLQLPDELDGAFTSVVIATFGASLEFAETQLFRQLNRRTVNRIVLADRRQLAQFLADEPRLRRLNRSYVTCPVRSPHAHHPKFVMLAGPTSGRLFVGSGNLSISGYAGPGECFTTYEYSSETGSPAPFAAVRELVETEAEFGWLDAVTIRRLNDAFEAAPWIPATANEAPVVHSLKRSLLEQLVSKVDGRSVKELVAAAPFHDRSGEAIRELLSELAPERFTLIVQNGRTRLDTGAVERAVTASGTEFQTLEASTPAGYPDVLLHAKFVIARTSDTDVLLQGSPNLSAIALCRSGADSNVEIANLLEGDSGAFDHLLNGIDLTTRPERLESFEPDDDWGESDDDEPDPFSVSGITWSPPNLSGTVATSGIDMLQISAAGRILQPVAQSWTQQASGAEFVFEFGPAEAAVIEAARSLEFTAANGSSCPVYPYHLNTLLRLSASGHRTDLLEEVGDLELHDKELDELLDELDRVLIVDRHSLWRLSNPGAPHGPNESDAEAQIDYNDLVWERIGTLPQLRPSHNGARNPLLEATDLGLVLSSLTSRFRIEARISGAELDPEHQPGEDLSVEPEREDPDEIDNDPEHDGEDAGARRLEPRARTRRMWRRFVARAIKGFSDAEFVDNVGPNVIVPTYLVLNLLCRRLRIVDLIDGDFLTAAQLDLWGFMWGTGSHAGYATSLEPDERDVACQLLADHDDLPATLAAIDDTWWHVWETGEPVEPLRDCLRRFLVSDHWSESDGVLNAAAAAASRIDDDCNAIFDDLYSLAGHIADGELDVAIATELALSPNRIRHMFDAVMRTGERHNVSFIELEHHELTSEQAELVISIWSDVEPDTTYFRLKAANGVAIVDLDHGTAEFFESTTGEEHRLDISSRPAPDWELRLEQLVDGVRS